MVMVKVSAENITDAKVAKRRAAVLPKVISKGICYTPYPSKATDDPALADGATFSQDDWMSDSAKPLWGPRGRADLLTMKALGANTVRMYGNNMLNDHRAFLDYADELGLKVIVGISNFPYNQMQGNCQSTGGDCFEVIRASYRENLRRGFATPERRYHPAIDHVIVINEPDIQLTYEPEVAVSWRDPKFWARGVISALDGVLQAEKDLGLSAGSRGLVPLTPTMTFANCHLCMGQDPTSTTVPGEIYPSRSRPSLGQMMELRNALLHPGDYGYAPRNNLTDFLLTRLLNSVNTKNPWIGIADRDLPDVRCTESSEQQGCRKQSVKTLFYDYYEVEFPDTPLYFEEYHSFWQWGYENTLADLNDVLRAAADSAVIKGLNFFEFQISYGKTEIAKKPDQLFEELLFGIFGLGGFNITDMEFFGTWTPVQCLAEIAFDPSFVKSDGGKGAFLPSAGITRAITEGYGGRGVDSAALCRPDPEKVPLTALGFSLVKSLGLDASAGCEAGMEAFVGRLVGGLGGMSTMNRGTRAFARRFCADGAGAAAAAPSGGRRWPSQACQDDRREFAQMVGELRRRPSWAWWSADASCVADRKSDASAVARTVDHLCKRGLRFFQCHRVPERCHRDVWRLADYVLSVYFDERRSLEAAPDPLERCYFDGAAVYMSAAAQFSEDGLDASCVVSRDPFSTPLTDEGFAAVRRSGSQNRSVVFIERVIAEKVNGSACQREKLLEFAGEPPSSMFELVRDLEEYWWVCGGHTRRACPSDGSACSAAGEGSLLRSPPFQVVLACTAAALLCAVACACIHASYLPDESAEWLVKHARRAAYVPRDLEQRERAAASSALSSPVLAPPGFFDAAAAASSSPAAAARAVVYSQGPPQPQPQLVLPGAISAPQLLRRP